MRWTSNVPSFEGVRSTPVVGARRGCCRISTRPKTRFEATAAAVSLQRAMDICF